MTSRCAHKSDMSACEFVFCFLGDVTNTGNGKPGTGVWELMYSGNPLENSKWRSKQMKGSKRNNLSKGEFPTAVPPDGQYVIVRAESD